MLLGDSKRKRECFDEKGIQWMYARSKNVETCVHELTSICMALDQLKILPKDTITDIIKGHSMATHVAFGKLFADFQSNLNNSLMGFSLKGTTMEQIIFIPSRRLHYMQLPPCPASGWK